jgi:Ca-activated chloride channel homolog
MSLVAPLSILFGLLAIPILLLYMLKLRRQEITVSSTLLWQMLLRDRQANTPWQRLKRSLLLFMQLLILAALVLALTRPAQPVPSLVSGPVVVILDASASMQTREGDTTRFEAARKAVHEMIDAMSESLSMTLILAGLQPEILSSMENDKGILREALESAQPSNGRADWEAVFSIAAGAANAAGRNGREASLVIVSDGGLPEDLPPLPVPVRYLPTGTEAENIAISALSLRPGSRGTELFARVTNYGPSAADIVLSFYFEEQLFEAQQIEIAGGESQSLFFQDLPESHGIYTARLSSPAPSGSPMDAFPLDDTAFAVHRPTREGRVLLISPGSVFLERALASIPEITPYRAILSPEPDPSEALLPGERFDLYVFDGQLPDELPMGNLLLVNPPPDPGFGIGEIIPTGSLIEPTGHPLGQYVDWSSVHIQQARQVDLPAWGESVALVDENPLIYAGELAGRRVAVLAFDLRDSDLPLHVAFPILFANLVNYLAPLQAFDARHGLQPGESLNLRGVVTADGRPAEQVVIASPSGRNFAYEPGESGLLFSDTGELGVYSVNFVGETSQSVEYFTVNLFDERESFILPAASIQVGRASISPTQPAELGLREFWPALAALALLLLLLEWWVYHRRQSSPKDWTTLCREWISTAIRIFKDRTLDTRRHP